MYGSIEGSFKDALKLLEQPLYDLQRFAREPLGPPSGPSLVFKDPSWTLDKLLRICEGPVVLLIWPFKGLRRSGLDPLMIVKQS